MTLGQLLLLMKDAEEQKQVCRDLAQRHTIAPSPQLLNELNQAMFKYVRLLDKKLDL